MCLACKEKSIQSPFISSRARVVNMSSESLMLAILGHLNDISSDTGEGLPARQHVAAEIPAYISQWLTCCSRTQALDADVPYNDMHACGMGICALLFHTTPSGASSYDTHDEFYGLDDLRHKIFIHDVEPHDMTWCQLQQIVHVIHIEFMALFEGGSDAAYTCRIDMPKLFLCVLQRMGLFLCNRFRDEEAPEEILAVDDNQVLDTDVEGWQTIRIEAVRQLLLGIHTVMSAYNLLVSARHVPTMSDDTTVEQCIVHEYHREASLDSFYEIDMIMTVPTSSVVEYQDKFRHLFHSVSQVVYYHFPNYQRRRQVSMAELSGCGVSPRYILPLLLEVDPTIQVLYEHTGAGCRATHAMHEYAWTVLGPFILLVDANMQSYCARDLRTLLRFKIGNVDATLCDK